LKTELKRARQIAEKYLNLLKPFCSRIEIAGSIRREKPEVKDIEIVCIPFDVEGFVALVKQWPKVKGEPTGKYTQRRLPEGIILDLFMAEERNWGLQMVIRTGPAEFNRSWLYHAKEKGLRCEGGFLRDYRESGRNGQMVECREEKDLFRLIGMNYIAPKYRLAKYS